MRFFILIIQWRIKLSLVKKTPRLALRPSPKLIKITNESIEATSQAPCQIYLSSGNVHPPILKNILYSDFMVCHRSHACVLNLKNNELDFSTDISWLRSPKSGGGGGPNIG